MHDKAFWKNILENDGKIPDGIKQADLTSELLDYLRSPDPQLRDEFAYQLLTHWIIGGNYNNETLNTFLDRWLADLQTGLGEAGTDSVLIRSFAALMLSILVFYDIKQSWLTPQKYRQLLDGVINYFLNEKDLCGYDSEKGWLHATAHTADALKFLARNQKSDKATLQRILDVLAEKITHPQPIIYTHGEDDRLALVILDVVKRGLIETEPFKKWLTQLVTVKDQLKPGIVLDEEAYGAVQNTRNFMRALHLTMAKNRAEVPQAGAIEYALYEQLLNF